MRLLYLVVNFCSKGNLVNGVWFHWKGFDYPSHTTFKEDSWEPYKESVHSDLSFDPMYLPTFFKGMGNEEVLMLKKDYVENYPNQWVDFLKDQIEQGKYIEINSCNH